MNKRQNGQKPVAEGLPELCFTTLPSTGDLICIKRGEPGYYTSSWNTDDKQRNQELADYNNERLGVTAEQSKAMEAGSMYGWDVPSADPANYENGTKEMTMGGMTCWHCWKEPCSVPKVQQANLRTL